MSVLGCVGLSMLFFSFITTDKKESERALWAALVLSSSAVVLNLMGVST